MCFHFLPDASRALNIDRAFRRSLADSLVYLSDVCAEHLKVDPSSIDGLVNGLKQGLRLGPVPFGLYSQLVLKLSEGDQEGATTIWNRLAASHSPLESMQVIGLDDPSLAPDLSMYAALMGTGGTDELSIQPPDHERVPSFLHDLHAALQLLDRVSPDLSGEIAALVTQLVMVSGNPNDSYIFDGGSCYMLWGALFINIERQRSIVELLEVLVHEAAHLLLYGFTIEEPLTTNSDQDLYPSPLRRDPRPMDGIFHATWVSARMYFAMDTLLQSNLLDADSCAKAQKAKAENRHNFDNGMGVIQEHGMLTMTGRALLESAAQAVHPSLRLINNG